MRVVVEVEMSVLYFWRVNRFSLVALGVALVESGRSHAIALALRQTASVTRTDNLQVQRSNSKAVVEKLNRSHSVLSLHHVFFCVSRPQGDR